MNTDGTSDKQIGENTDKDADSYEEKPRPACMGSGRIEKKFQLKHLQDLIKTGI